MAQHSLRRLLERDAVEREGLARRSKALHVAQHPRRLAQDHVEVDVDRVHLQQRVGDPQPAVGSRSAEHRERAALALGERAEVGAFIQLRDDILGLALGLHQDVARLVFGEFLVQDAFLVDLA